MRLLKSICRQDYPIVDGHSVHRSAVITWFRLIRLPDYRSELNTDELLNQEVKPHELGKNRPANLAEVVKTVWCHLHRRQKKLQVIKDLF